MNFVQLVILTLEKEKTLNSTRCRQAHTAYICEFFIYHINVEFFYWLIVNILVKKPNFKVLLSALLAAGVFFEWIWSRLIRKKKKFHFSSLANRGLKAGSSVLCVCVCVCVCFESSMVDFSLVFVRDHLPVRVFDLCPIVRPEQHFEFRLLHFLLLLCFRFWRFWWVSNDEKIFERTHERFFSCLVKKCFVTIGLPEIELNTNLNVCKLKWWWWWLGMNTTFFCPFNRINRIYCTRFSIILFAK